MANRLFRERIPGEDETEKQGAALFFSILRQNLWELIGLNLLFILFSLPVVTLPAALTAMSNVTLKMAREEIYTFREDFVGMFKASFVRSLALGVPFGLILTATYFLVPFYRTAVASSVLFYVPLAIVVLATLVVLMAGMYAFPMLAAVELPLMQIVRNAVLLAFLKLPRNALAMLEAGFLWLLVLVSLPFSLIIIAAFLFSLLNFIGSFCAWSGIQKYVLKGR